MSATATFIKTLAGFYGDARLFHTDPPLRCDTEAYEHVVVSAVVVSGSGPETYIFGATAEGAILDWAELPGSFRGGLDHEEALRRAGYEVTP